MLIDIEKKDLILETSGNVGMMTPIVRINDASGLATNLTRLSFEGFSGFNEKYVVPLFELMRTIVTKKDVGMAYRSMKLVGNLRNDSNVYSANYYIFKNIRDTNFLFKPLKGMGITITDLRIGYGVRENATDPADITLFLDRKILQYMNNVGPSCKEVVMYFYCLAKFLATFDKICPVLGTKDTGELTILESDLQSLIYNYGDTPETMRVECIPLSEEIFFKSVQYTHSMYTPFIKDLSSTKYGSTFVYNVIKTGAAQVLCIINVTCKEYYLIDKAKGVVYTNNSLREFNVFEILEWIPNLVSNLAELSPKLDKYEVKCVPLDKLLSSKSPEVIISNDATEFEALLELYPTISENTNKDLYKGYFIGSTIKFEGATETLEEYYSKDAYAQELYKQVQPYYASFDLKELTGLVRGMAKGDVYSMLFEGDSGTGKSTAARVLASRCGLPFVAINCSTNIEESDMFGTMIPNPTKKSADDPEFIWQDGPLTKAVRYGYVAIVEELGGARPGVLMKLNSLLDEAHQIDLPNGEIVKAHKNFKLIATTNIAYEGTNRLNKALVNRFEVCHKFVDLDEKEAKEVIRSRTGYTKTDVINRVYDVYKAVKKYSDEQNLGIIVSIRQLLNVFRQGKYYKNIKEAVTNLMLYQAFVEEPDHLEHFMTTVLSAMSLTAKI